MAKIVENELAENVHNLNSYIKDTTDFLRKLSEIQQPLPKGAIMLSLKLKLLFSRTRSNMSNAHSVVNDLLVRPCKAA
jgi:hypothetical protein